MTIYHILAALAGTLIGVIVMSVCAVGHGEDSYHAGYAHGHEDGFRDGVKSWTEVG